jgi:hypothetical protein
MFTSYCDASILSGYRYIGYLIKTKDNTYTKRFELSPNYNASNGKLFRILSI